MSMSIHIYKSQIDMARPLDTYDLLSFDCYGTLVDWESGIFQGLKPLIDRLGNQNSLRDDKITILRRYMYHEGRVQKAFPTLKYASILSKVYEELASEWGLRETVTDKESAAFGASIGSWSVFPDTLAALLELQKHFKLVILSNVDKESFSKTLAGPLAGFKFDAIYIAEEIGSYKPDLNNFQYLVQHCEKGLQVPKEKILHTAYALIHDLTPAHKLGLSTCWIERKPNAMGGELSQVQGQLSLDFRFRSMGDMADAIRSL
ncbi:haloalkanoic acid dehalogenase, putative [Talaromyces stipitatus ATCC 10500]|uniref:Haloalkanoic acid dehalogenase, putative n=1 Tax=Talaromyces stipitatus (strain ATCC 10500 / CBS 375.48 / QM 6759 / NRRL 1006) TaxID=441959 RepID=B8M128_TALSN|nr:haloalkanoic acid dehalogenase, putative [Talaromyces stipitatus ATCC 10500]EED20970.1 haloalkanoic acid dehalogenase, putative [Talaromyces stipitatus ATCC 10500]